MIPEYGIGFWQCKLRYRTQEELLTVAREYKRRGLPIDAIVVDFFHWTMQGDFKFDPKDWPDPEAMIRELRESRLNRSYPCGRRSINVPRTMVRWQIKGISSRLTAVCALI